MLEMGLTPATVVIAALVLLWAVWAVRRMPTATTTMVAAPRAALAAWAVPAAPAVARPIAWWPKWTVACRRADGPPADDRASHGTDVVGRRRLWEPLRRSPFLLPANGTFPVWRYADQ